MDNLRPAELEVFQHTIKALASAPPAAQLRIAAALVQDAAYRSAPDMASQRLARLVELAAELDRLASA